MFKTATKHEAKLRLALIGPAGSGKTYSALSIATALSDKIAVMDTEHGSASKYADAFSFDVVEPASFNPQVYIDAIAEAEKSGYGVLIIDSLSHAWMGKDGALELVDRAAARMKNSNSYVAWRDVTPLHNKLIDAIIGSQLHIIATMRSKMEYVQEKDGNGRTTIRKVGLQPVQRDGLEYEFDVVGDLDQDNTLTITKTRCPQLTGAIIQKPGKQLAGTLAGWLSGAPLPERSSAPQRPYTAEVAREHVVAHAAKLNMNAPAGNGTLTASMASLSGLLHNDDGKRKAVLRYLFNVESGSALTDGQAKAIQKWIDAKPNAAGEWIPGAHAITEAERIITADAIARGQQTLPLSPTGDAVLDTFAP